MQVQWEILLIFTGLVAVGMLLQGIVMIGMLVAVRRAVKRFEAISQMVEEHVVPAVTKARELLEDVSPKLRTAAENVAAASQTLRTESVEVSQSVGILLKKSEAQIDRVDEMITGSLNSIAHATAAMQRAVLVPARQAGALLSGVRAALDILRGRPRQSHSAADGEHFV
jgi:uncharacterized protein YoxC